MVCADSTGHGVPGAIMSILNISSLEKAIETQTEPHSILNETRKIIIDRLKKDGSAKGGKDGMDCTLLVFDPDHTQLTFAAAHNPVWIVRKNEKNSAELIEFKADKMPVGKHDRDFESFTNQTFKLQQNDMIYMLTDGIPDQFGGPKGKKYMHKNLKELLIAISSESVEIQKEKLDRSFKNWKADLEQIDDVCLIGVRI
ncbi:MAG: serine/threonine-protein phosphatase [Crocinitomicaceae bacterium]|nr:serine/threonine-protein phosphatase [Crocinitomicaceae bacterium]